MQTGAGSNTLTTISSYDAADRLQTANLNSDTSITSYGYDANSSLISESATSAGSYVISYTYDTRNRLTNWQKTGTNPGIAAFSYERANRLTSLAHLSSGGSTIFGVSYSLDKLGNRIAASENVSGTTQSLSYSYDELSRLTADTNS